MQDPNETTVTDADLAAILARDPYSQAALQAEADNRFHDDWRDETPIHIEEPNFAEWDDGLTEDERWELEEETMPVLKCEKYWFL